MRKTIIILFAIAMALTAVAQTNLALNKTAIATSGTASLAVDGNNGTRWESAHNDAETWQVDLGQDETFNTITIRWEGAYSASFEIITGIDGCSLDENGYIIGGTTVFKIENQTLSGDLIQKITFDAQSARYIKFKGLKRATEWGNSFFEFEVYNDPDVIMSVASLNLIASKTNVPVGETASLSVIGTNAGGYQFNVNDASFVVGDNSIGSVSANVFTALSAGTTTIKAIKSGVESNSQTINSLKNNLALNKNVLATSQGLPASEAVDGNMDTRWASVASDPQTWQVDLGEAKTFNTVVIHWEGAYSSSFTITTGNEVGSDGYVTNGTTVFETNNQSLGTVFPYKQTIVFDAQTARFIKFEGTKRGTGYGHSFWEFEVYNEANNSITPTSINLSTATNDVTRGTSIDLIVVGKDDSNFYTNITNANYILGDNTIGSVSNNEFTGNATGSTTVKAVIGNLESNEITLNVVNGIKIDLFSNWQTRIYNFGIATNDSKVGAFDTNENSDWNLPGKSTGDSDEARTYDAGFIADLCGIYDISNIDILFEGACSQEFTLAFAGADGVFGNTVYAGGTHTYGINGHTESFSGQEVTNVRYVKFLSTKAATSYGMKIRDFAVYGILRSTVSDSEAPTISSLTAGTATENSITLNVTGSDNSSKYMAYEVTATGVPTVISAQGSYASGSSAAVTISGLSSGTEYYFSVVAIDAFGNRSSVETIIASTTGNVFVLTAAPVPTKAAENVKSIYSDAYTPATAHTIGYWDGYQTTKTDEVVNGDNIIKFGNFHFIGLQYNTDIDISDMEYIHIDVLPMEEMTLGITPIMRGGLTEKSTSVGTLNVKQWNSIDLPLADFGFDLTYLTHQFKFDQGNGEVVYIDNVYFWKGGTTPPPTPTELEVDEIDANGVVILNGAWDADAFRAIDAVQKANAYDFTAVTGLPTTFNNQNMASNPNAFFIAPVAGTFLFNEVVPKSSGEGYNGYNIQIIDHFANEADHSVNTSIAPIDVVSPFFQRVTRMGGVYTTTILPFVNTLPSNVKFYRINDVSVNYNTNASVAGTSVVYLTEVDKANVQAGVPYIVYLEGADITIAGGGATTITWETTPQTILTDIVMNGSFGKQVFSVAPKTNAAPRLLEGENAAPTPVNYALPDVTSSSDALTNGLTLTETREVPAFSGYLEVYDRTLTGVNDLNVNPQDVIFNIYTLDGRVVRQNVQSAEGLERGIYIIKGEKVLVK